MVVETNDDQRKTEQLEVPVCVVPVPGTHSILHSCALEVGPGATCYTGSYRVPVTHILVRVCAHAQYY